MSNCKESCRPGYIPGPPAPHYISGCALEQNPTLKTYILPASMGTDDPGQPYQPRPGEWYNAVVIYEANGHIYIYDSLGTPTLINGNGGGSSGSIPDQTVQRGTSIVFNVNDLGLNVTTGTLYAGTSNSSTIYFPKASPTSAGFMTASDYNNFLTTVGTVEQMVDNGLSNLKVVQEKGTSTSDVMSQLAVTGQLNDLDKRVSDIEEGGAGGSLKTINGESLKGEGDIKLQVALESGKTIKTVNGQSLLGEGDIVIEGSGEAVSIVQEMGQSTISVMSQKAVTDVIGDVEGLLERLDTGTGV